MLSFYYDHYAPVVNDSIIHHIISSSTNSKWHCDKLFSIWKLITCTQKCLSTTNRGYNETRNTDKMVTYNVSVHRDFNLETSKICTKNSTFLKRRKNSTFFKSHWRPVLRSSTVSKSTHPAICI